MVQLGIIKEDKTMSDNINNTNPPSEPLTRVEQYLSAIAGVTSSNEIPEEPLTRIEEYLNKIVENGGGGGGGGTVNNAKITIQKNGTTVDSFTSNQATDKTINITVPTSAADVSALPDTTKYAAALSLTINSSTFVVTGQLIDQDGNDLGTAQTIDLPLESVVVDGSYNSQTKKVVLTLQNGNTIEFSVADLVSGLQTELSASNKLNPAYINYDSTHAAVTEAQRDQIETNKNNILTVAKTGGAKNVLYYNLAYLKNINTAGTWSDNVYTRGNVTFTLNSDGTISIETTGTPNNALLFLRLSVPNIYGAQVISGASTGSGTINVEQSTSPYSFLAQDQGNGATIPNNTAANINIYIRINSELSDTVIFKPMICSNDDWNISREYQTGAMSNAEITAWILSQT